MQVLPNGNVFVGWGSAPAFSEFSHEGELLFDASYRPRRVLQGLPLPVEGLPEIRPALAAEAGQGDKVKIYASWNGATEVATWQVLAGGPKKLKEFTSAPKEGFETVITVETTEPYVGVKALDASGKVLGSSKAIQPENN